MRFDYYVVGVEDCLVYVDVIDYGLSVVEVVVWLDKYGLNSLLKVRWWSVVLWFLF